MDFDDMLAEAENEAGLYDDYIDDIEAEMAMEAEVKPSLYDDYVPIVLAVFW